MRTIRNGVFETNSSSCHVVTLINKDDYENLKFEDKIVINFVRDVCEHETVTEIIDHDNVVSPENAVILLQPKIESTILDDSDPTDLRYLIDKYIQDNWGEDLLNWTLSSCYGETKMGKEITKKVGARYVIEPYEIKSYLREDFGISYENYNSLYSVDWENTVGPMEKIWTPRGDCVYVTQCDVSC